MVKTIIIETTEYYDPDGNLVKKEERREESEDDNPFYPSWPTFVPAEMPDWMKNPIKYEPALQSRDENN